jgi:ADP-ribose pyrophosphatase
VARQIVFRGRKIQVALDTTLLPNGETVHRDVILHPGAVAILPLVDAEHLCLVRNRRPIVGETLLEIPAGTLEPQETADQAAPRELAEETGYQAKKWRKLAVFYPSPGVLDERTHLFVAEDLTPGQQQLEKDEDMATEIMSWQDAVNKTLDGSIHDAKTIIAVLLWDRLRGAAS